MAIRIPIFDLPQFCCVLLIDIRRKMLWLWKSHFPAVGGGDAFSVLLRAAVRRLGDNSNTETNWENTIKTLSEKKVLP